MLDVGLTGCHQLLSSLSHENEEILVHFFCHIGNCQQLLGLTLNHFGGMVDFTVIKCFFLV